MTRFWSKVDKTEGCWNWTASLDVNGYGHFRFEHRTAKAHRVAYELVVGRVPEGLVLDHLCRNRRCVRPDHLEPVTSRENTLRGETLAADQITRTHCPRGHPHSGYNGVIYGDGKRRCRECRNDIRRRYRARLRSA